jgi:hypothetical protein
MAEMGHTNPKLALSISAQAMRRDDGEAERLRALVEGADWAPLGTSATDEMSGDVVAEPEKDENPRQSGGLVGADDGIRTHDLLHGKQTL